MKMYFQLNTMITAACFKLCSSKTTLLTFQVFKYAHRPRFGLPQIPPRDKATSRSMTTAYSGEAGDGTLGLEQLKYIPYKTALRNGKKVEIGPFTEIEWARGMELMNLIIREGKSWPFVDEFETMEGYRSYFLSHAAFVVRSIDEKDSGSVLGCFYIKPNFPGRCSHICNGGFITAPEYRRMGVATLMGTAFCRLAKDLGYKSSYFNLVFRSNKASVGLWEKLNFERGECNNRIKTMNTQYCIITHIIILC